MIADLKPYPAYRDSGVPWLGEVPEHWEARRIKQVCRLAYGRSLPAEDRERGSTPVFGSNGRVGAHSFANTSAPCIVVGRKGSFGKVAYSPTALFAIDTTYYIDSGQTDQLVRWLYYLLAILGLDRVSKDSAVPGLAREDVYGITVPLPPLPEQAAIVRFLDHADRRIRRYIRAKRKLIKLLAEQKQAIIHQAVTCGLDPNVKLKPSGVEWLGEVPEHWEVVRLKAVCTRIVDCKNRTPDRVEGGDYWVVRTTCIREGSFDPSGGYPTDFRNYAAWTVRGAPRSGDVFFTREAPAGEACLVPQQDNLCMGQRTMFLRPNPELLDPEFLLLSIYGPLTRTCVEQATNGSTVGHLRLGQVYGLPLMWCPLEEQLAIVKHAVAATGQLSAGATLARSEITLLRELRTRLIADVVTGKLDVRAAAALLPDESDEPEPMDEVESLEGDEGLDDEDGVEESDGED